MESTEDPFVFPDYDFSQSSYAMSEVENTTPYAQAKRRQRQKQQRKCTECGQTFSKAEHLARHIRSHTRERPFQCHSCGKTYTRHDSLLRHSRIHTDECQTDPTASRHKDLSPMLSAVAQSTSADSALASMIHTEMLPMGGNAPSSVDWPQSRSTAAQSSSHCQVEQLLGNTFLQPTSPSGPRSIPWPGSISTASGEFADIIIPELVPASQSASVDLDNINIWHNFQQEPPWLLESDFDFNDLNLQVPMAQAGWGHVDFISDHALVAGDTESEYLGPGSAVHQQWFTRFPQNSAAQPSRATPSVLENVDDAYRDTLSHRLRPGVSNVALPSADFLNLCIKLYFSKFSPAFPIIHAPSFRPSSENALLLLSICSIGSLLVGSAGATAQGRRIFQVLNKAILASWEKYIGGDKQETLSLSQAAILGQTFGMLSGQPQDLCMTETFHGTVIAWARQSGFFRAKESSVAISGGDVEASWKAWVQNEESIRLVAGLYIHDSEFSTTFHHEPLLRHGPGKLAMSCSEELFVAPTASHWHALLQKNQLRMNSSRLICAEAVNQPVNRLYLHPYALLGGIMALIQEARQSQRSDELVQRCRSQLLNWHDDQFKYIHETRSSYLSLMILWHTTFLMLYADFDLLERSIGREGAIINESVPAAVRTWASSSSARLGVLHALLIRRHAEALAYSVEPAIHVPKALFYSGIITYCFIKFRSATKAYTPSITDISVEELQVTSSNKSYSHSSEKTLPALLSPIDPSIMCSCIDLLRRVGHWGISQRYASILETLLEDIARSAH